MGLGKKNLANESTPGSCHQVAFLLRFRTATDTKPVIDAYFLPYFISPSSPRLKRRGSGAFATQLRNDGGTALKFLNVVVGDGDDASIADTVVLRRRAKSRRSRKWTSWRRSIKWIDNFRRSQSISRLHKKR